jgi:hypothetical protein
MYTNKRLTSAQKRVLRAIASDTLPYGACHRTVKRLAIWGYIILTHSLADGRVIAYRLTDKGQERNV